jgi:hypothetical protein
MYGAASSDGRDSRIEIEDTRRVEAQNVARRTSERLPPTPVDKLFLRLTYSA